MRGRISCARVLVVVVASCCFVSAFGAGVAIANSHVAAAPKTVGHVTYQGTVDLGRLPRAQSSSSTTRPRVADPVRLKSAQPSNAATVANPNPNPEPLAPAPGSPLGFVGLTAAASGAVNGSDVEPPDQGLCAHSGTAIELVNLAVGVYAENGITLRSPVSLNSFFGQAPVASSNGSKTTYGPFLSDPRCYYDKQTNRWFATTLEIDVNPQTGAFGTRSHELVAVSKTSDPTGSYAIFKIDTTNDGTNGTAPEPNCPCFGDQPRIGADAHGFYISTDSYPIQGLFNSNGGEIYAVSKQQLAAAADGAPPPVFVAIHNGAVPIQGEPANAVQPAQTPEGAAYAADREYFLSTPDFNGFATSGGVGANSVVLWTLLNTSSLSSANPSLTLTDSIVRSESYTPPVPATQKPGPRPLGDSLGEPLPPISVNDDRMQQVEYLLGKVYSSLNTAVGSGQAVRSGVAWFQVATNDTSGTVSRQGYLAANNGASLMYPAIGLNPNDRGAMTFSVSGPTTYPSSAYVPFTQGPSGGTVYVTGAGTAPEDGFTCYKSLGFGPACRWGDYSAASADGAGHIVMADEMIPNVARDRDANWGTYLSTLTP